jgi:hypothetical protein
MRSARVWAEEALALNREFGDEHGEADSLWQLGYINVEEGETLPPLRRCSNEPGSYIAVLAMKASLSWASRTLAFAYLRMGDKGSGRGCCTRRCTTVHVIAETASFKQRHWAA